GGGHDPQTQVGTVSTLFAKGEPKDGQAPQPRHVLYAQGGRTARTRRAVLQAPPLRSAMEARGTASRVARARNRRAGIAAVPCRAPDRKPPISLDGCIAIALARG